MLYQRLYLDNNPGNWKLEMGGSRQFCLNWWAVVWRTEKTILLMIRYQQNWKRNIFFDIFQLV